MDTRLSIKVVAITLFILLSVSYVLCVAAGLLFEWSQMYQAWTPLLPGFTWPPTVGRFLLGLLWIVGYSLYGAILWVVPYNYLARRRSLAGMQR